MCANNNNILGKSQEKEASEPDIIMGESQSSGGGRGARCYNSIKSVQPCFASLCSKGRFLESPSSERAKDLRSNNTKRRPAMFWRIGMIIWKVKGISNGGQVTRWRRYSVGTGDHRFAYL